VKEWTGRKCSVPGCNFELCLYSVGEPERTFPLCPYCYNNPKPEWGPIPGEDSAGSEDPIERQDEAKERHYRRIGGRSLLLECPHPDGHPLIKDMTVSPDPKNDGVFVIDAHLGPKWRLVGTRSPTVVYLPKNIEKITILDKAYDEFGSHVMRIEFKESAPLDDGTKKYDSCFATDEKLQKLSRFYQGHERTQQSFRGGRKGGRSGGRGGRGGRGNARGGRR
jgi:DNA topoisomerase-3